MTSTDVTKSNKKTRKQLDDYTCGLIIGRHLANQNPTEISSEMNIPRTTVIDCINRYNKTGTGVIKKRSGRPPKLSERDERAMVRNFREQPFVSFVEHAANLKDAGINIHPQTLSIYARRNGFGSHTPASVPMLRSTSAENLKT